MSVIWEAKLDDRYECKVVQIDEHRGCLTVIDQDNTVLLNNIVDLMYGAVFGPDISDINNWQEQCLGAVPELD